MRTPISRVRWRHRVARHAVEPDRRQHQRQRAEHRQHQDVHLQRLQRVADLLLERAHVEHRQRRVELARRAADRIRQRRRVTGRCARAASPAACSSGSAAGR